MFWLLVVAYIGTIFAANWAVATFGVVPVAPGLVAPAAVFFVGLAFPLRDFIQRKRGRLWSIGAMLVGVGLSFLVTPHFAIASGVTFLVSETIDLGVYTLLARWFVVAVLVSAGTALVVDSAVFLTLAFGSLTFFWGQVVGKAYMAVLGGAIAWIGRNGLLSRNAPPALARAD